MDKKTESNRLTDLVQRLRNYPVWTGDCHDAADALEEQANRIAELEAALKDIIADMNGIQNPLINVRAISVGALNAASKVLGEKE